jgi:hypothetical protein
MAADWLTALDDDLLDRPRQCSQCGATAYGWGWFGILEVHTHLALAILQCQNCHRQDPDQGRLLALLRQRYGA